MTAPSQAVERYTALVQLSVTADGVALADPETRAVVLATDFDALTARVRELEAALKPLAGIPLEEFGWERSPDRPVTGWNKHTLYVRDVLAARAAIANSPKEPA